MVLSIAIVIAFFLPWFKIGGSGLDIVLSKGETTTDVTTEIVRYSFLLIPLFALFVLLRTISKKPAGFLLRLIPFLVTAILSTLFVIGIQSQGGNVEMQSFFSILGYGFYITVIASFLLLFV